jgi:imidazolonepropionase-like amidohydrolase
MSRTILTSASVLDGEHAPRRNCTVVVEGQRITEVSDQVVERRPDDTVYDLGGRTVMPGMIICHFHTQFGPFADFGNNEIRVSSERPPGFLIVAASQNALTLLGSGWTSFVSGACAFNQDVELKMAIEEGIIAGPRILPASPHMDTTANDQDRTPWWRETSNNGVELFCDGPDEFRKAVRQQVKMGVEMIKLFATGGPGVRGAFDRRQLTHAELVTAIETAHDLGVKVRAHCCWEAEMIECIEAGIDVIDHGSDMNAKVAEMMVDHGVFWAPTMHFLKGFMAEAPDVLSIDVLKASFEAECKSLALANEAGVKILAGDDYGVSAIPHVLGIYGEGLGVFVDDAGISPLDAIRFATRHGAELIGKPGELGTIAPGALADLVVVDGDPSADIGLLADPVSNMPAIMKDGEFYKNELA